VLAVTELPDDVRANLSPEAQAWCQTAVEHVDGQMMPGVAVSSDSADSVDSTKTNHGRGGVKAMSVGEEAIPISGLEARVGRIFSASDRTRRIILENLGIVEKKTLRELVANAGIVVANTSFDTIYYETTKTMQIAKEMGLVKEEV
jgi:hypothetical protein